MAAERLQVILELVDGQYKREARAAASATSEIGGAARASSGSMGVLGGAVSQAQKALKAFGGAAAVGAIVKFGADSVKAASDLEESMNAVNVVFGTSAETITNFGEKAATSAGLAQAEFQEMASVLGSALLNAGVPLDEAAAKTIELTQRAADMASVFNTSVPDALGAMQAALRGESDPIEKFGVTLSAIAVDSEAAALGFQRVNGQFDAQAKAAARLSLIMKQTDRVQGDFANTSDGLANSSKILTANLTNLKAQIGGFLTPVMAELTSEAGDSIEAFSGFVDIVDKATDALFRNEGATNAAREAVDQYNGVFDFLLPNLTVGFAQFNELNTAIEENALASQKAFEKGDELAEAHDSWTIDAAQYAALGLGPTIAMLDRQTTSHRNAAAAADTQRRAMINLFTAQADLLDPVRSVLLLQKESIEANKRLAEVQANTKSTTTELALAVIEAEQAELRLQSAGAALTPDQIQAFAQVLISELNMSEDAALRTLQALGLLDGWEGKAHFTLEMETAVSGGGGRGNINSLFDEFGFASGGVIPGARGSQQIVLAHGGETIVPAGKSMGGGVQIVVQSPMNDFRSDLQYATILASVTNLVEGF